MVAQYTKKVSTHRNHVQDWLSFGQVVLDGAAVVEGQETPYPGEHIFAEACLLIRKGLNLKLLEEAGPLAVAQSLDENQKPAGFDQTPVVVHKPVV